MRALLDLVSSAAERGQAECEYNCSVECPGENSLLGLVQGTLDEPVARSLAEHLRGCEECRLIVEWQRAPSAGQSTPPSASEPRATAGAPERYELLALLGSGGMGDVFRARDRELGRLVALKLLLRGAGEEAQRRFLQEAQTQARVAHQNVLRVFDVGRDAGGLPFIALQLVAGPTLQQAARELPLREKVELMVKVADAVQAARELPPREKVELMVKVADAVQAAHELGLVHRDLKPQNVLLEPRPQGGHEPYVADFGLVRDVLAPELTKSGVVLGTPQYMAPEQARGLPIDARADVYGLGATLFSVLTNAAPFSGRTDVEVLYQVVHREAPRLRSRDGALDRDLEPLARRRADAGAAAGAGDPRAARGAAQAALGRAGRTFGCWPAGRRPVGGARAAPRRRGRAAGGAARRARGQRAHRLSAPRARRQRRRGARRRAPACAGAARHRPAAALARRSRGRAAALPARLGQRGPRCRGRAGAGRGRGHALAALAGRSALVGRPRPGVGGPGRGAGAIQGAVAGPLAPGGRRRPERVGGGAGQPPRGAVGRGREAGAPGAGRRPRDRGAAAARGPGAAGGDQLAFHGDVRGAAAACDIAKGELEAAVGAARSDPRAHGQLCTLLKNRIVERQFLGTNAEADAALQSALAACGRALRVSPKRASLYGAVAAVHQLRAAQTSEGVGGKIAALRQCVALAEQGVAIEPENPIPRLAVAKCQMWIGVNTVHFGGGETEEALQKASAAIDAALHARPQWCEAQRCQAQIFSARGTALAAAGQDPRPMFDQAVAVLEPLQRTAPRSLLLSLDLVMTHSQRAQWELDHGLDPTAEQERAIAQGERAASSGHPMLLVVALAEQLGTTADARRFEEREARLRTAVAAAEKFPGNEELPAVQMLVEVQRVALEAAAGADPRPAVRKLLAASSGAAGSIMVPLYRAQVQLLAARWAVRRRAAPGPELDRLDALAGAVSDDRAPWSGSQPMQIRAAAALLRAEWLLGARKDAARLLGAAEKAIPQDASPPTLILRAQLARLRGQRSKAAELLDRALQLRKQMPEALDEQRLLARGSVIAAQ